MKYLLALLFTICVAAGQQECPEDMSPAVHKFITERVLVDDSKLYIETRKWLDAQKTLRVNDRDQMWEIVSGLIWEKDKALARKLLDKIKNEKMRKKIMEQYDVIDDIDATFQGLGTIA